MTTPSKSQATVRSATNDQSWIVEEHAGSSDVTFAMSRRGYPRMAILRWNDRANDFGAHQT
jgi:hypothetical protein